MYICIVPPFQNSTKRLLTTAVSVSTALHFEIHTLRTVALKMYLPHSDKGTVLVSTPQYIGTILVTAANNYSCSLAAELNAAVMYTYYMEIIFYLVACACVVIGVVYGCAMRMRLIRKYDIKGAYLFGFTYSSLT